VQRDEELILVILEMNATFFGFRQKIKKMYPNSSKFKVYFKNENGKLIQIKSTKEFQLATSTPRPIIYVVAKGSEEEEEEEE
jgi:hypothetical protein